MGWPPSLDRTHAANASQLAAEESDADHKLRAAQIGPKHVQKRCRGPVGQGLSGSAPIVTGLREWELERTTVEVWRMRRFSTDVDQPYSAKH